MEILLEQNNDIFPFNKLTASLDVTMIVSTPLLFCFLFLNCGFLAQEVRKCSHIQIVNSR